MGAHYTRVNTVHRKMPIVCESTLAHRYNCITQPITGLMPCGPRPALYDCKEKKSGKSFHKPLNFCIWFQKLPTVPLLVCRFSPLTVATLHNMHNHLKENIMLLFNTNVTVINPL